MRAFILLAKKFWWQRGLAPQVKVMQAMIVLGVGVSIASLIITLGVAQGFEQEYKKGLLDFNAHVTVLPSEDISFSKEVLEETLSKQDFPTSEILGMTPFLYREGLLTHDGTIKGVLLKGVPKENLPKPVPAGEILLGKALASRLHFIFKEGVEEKGGLKLLIPEGKEVSEKNLKPLTVGGVFESGIYEIDSQFALIDLESLQRLFQLPEDFHGYEIRLRDPSMAPQVALLLREGIGPLIDVQDWIRLHQPLFEAVQLEKWVFRILMGLMVFVASLNLIGVILLSISRRKKAIAILQSLGLSARRVRWLFAGHGFFLGGVGVCCGALLGAALLWGIQRFSLVSIDPQIYFLNKLPAVLIPRHVFIIAAFGLLLIGLSSWKAARGVSGLSIREGLHGPG